MFRLKLNKVLCEEVTNPLYKEYTAYVQNELEKQSKDILSFEAWRMENDENYRDDVLDSDPYYSDVPTDTTSQEHFDDVLDMYDIAGING